VRELDQRRHIALRFDLISPTFDAALQVELARGMQAEMSLRERQLGAFDHAA